MAKYKVILKISLQELVDYCDSHPEHQKEIIANRQKFWNMTLDEMIEMLMK